MHSVRLTTPPSRRVRRSTGRFTGVAFGALLVACAGQDPAHDYFGQPAPPDKTSAQDGAAGATGAPTSNDPPQHDDFEVVDMEEAACDRVLEGTVVPDPDGGRPVILRLRATATSWLAESSYDSGFFRMSADGSSFEDGLLQLGSLDRVAVVGAQPLIVSTNENGVIWGSYDSSTGLTAAAAVAPAPVYELAVGSSGELGLVTWATNATVRARLLDANGPRGEALDLLDGVVTDSFRAAVGEGDDGFIVAWSTRRVSDSAFVSRVVTVSPEGAVGPVHILYESPGPHQVVEIAATSDGAVLLIEDDGAPLLVPLAPDGFPRRDAQRFAEGAAAYSLAAGGSRVLLGARLADGRDALRLLDEDGQPDGGWQCLHGEASDDEHSIALAADGASFVALFRDEDGANRWVTVD
jgi:hypothetical protein